MSRWHVVYGFISCALCAAIGAALESSRALAGDVEPITKIEVRSLPPEVVTQRAFSQLSKIVHIQPYPAGGPPPRFPLSDLWFWTSPRATYAPELCAADHVTVYFRPVTAETNGAKTKTVADAISARTYYRFLHVPASPTFYAMNWPDILATRQRCISVNPEHDNMFSARDEETAVEGIWLIAELSRNLKAEPYPLVLDCKDYRGGDSQCLSDAKSMAPERVSDINRCDSIEEGIECWEINQIGLGSNSNGNDIGVRLFVRMVDRLPRIEKVHPIQWVTVADARAD